MSERERQLASNLRARGVRKKTAAAIARATEGEGKPEDAYRAIDDLASVVDEIGERLRDGPDKPSWATRLRARPRKRGTPKRKGYSGSWRVRSWTELVESAKARMRARFAQAEPRRHASTVMVALVERRIGKSRAGRQKLRPLSIRRPLQ